MDGYTLATDAPTAERRMIMPKNVMCKKCNNLINGWCEKKIDSPDPNMVRDCQYFWEKTNADRIRAMSDEELAEFIRDVSYECQDAHWGSKCQSCDFPWCSSDQTLVWLQQPAEGTP